MVISVRHSFSFYFNIFVLKHLICYLLYQVAGTTASPQYNILATFTKKNSSFCLYVVLLSYHPKQLHIFINCYAYVIMDF